jgi:DNA primase
VIPAGFIQDLLSRIDVAEVVGRHVELKKAGINLKGLCPFHGEKTPSFIVSPSRQTYHCFGCGAHGDALRFLMERNGLGFVDAVHDLAQQAGMQVPEDDTSPAERERAAEAKARQATLTEVLAKAAEHYRAQLKASPRAIDYLKRRGLTGAIAARFGLGYAPGGWHALASAFARYDDPLLVDAGLVIVQGEDDDAAAQRRYDRFRDRVMFPIRSVQGEVIGFGGRVLDQGEPKYLNSPETPVFVKGRELYGLHEARQALRQHGFVLVVEGYMDVVGLAQLGFANAVATLGTACTADHVQKLFRFTDSVVFSFDGDAAGRRAAGRALEAALPHATDTRTIRFLFLPPEHDPDSYIREHGSEAFGQQIEQAVPLSRQLVEAAREGCDLATAEGRARCLAQARPLWQALPDGLLARQILGDLAQLAQLDSAELRALWQHESASPRGREAATAPPPPRPARPARRALATGTPTLLDRALWLLLARCELWNELPAAAHDRLASQPAPYGPAFAWLERHLNEHGAETAEALLAQMPVDELGPQGPALQRRVAEFHDNDPGVDLAAQLGWVLDELELKMLKEEMDLLVESGLADPAMTARYRELQQRFADLKQKLAARA